MSIAIRNTLILVFIAILAVSALAAYLHFAEGKLPQIRMDPLPTHATRGSSFSLEVTDEGQGLSHLLAQAVQGERQITLLEEIFGPDQHVWNGAVTLPKQGLNDGSMEIVIKATDKSLANWMEGNTTLFRHQLIFDATPPRISVISDAHNVNQGGAGLIVYSLSEEAVSGVMVQDIFFPGYCQESGVYLCLFAIPFDVDPTKHRPMLTATDLAGNTAQISFRFHGNQRSFRQDTMNISQAFLENVMPQFQSLFPEAKDLLELYLLVNRDLRARNIAFVRSLGTTTAPAPLWSEVFARQPRSASLGGYADHRISMYNDEIIDQHVHLGIDLASIAFAEIIASNRGQVIFANDLGIYGQTVILDHGLGLHTLYAHLSQIFVETGSMVEKGQILGRSGMTGLAAGDHLHFETLVSGIAVNPHEWWDEQWLQHNFWSKLEALAPDSRP
jgi:murein DD-endopeptidase MepM/ murein hydrolase activator NlpD